MCRLKKCIDGGCAYGLNGSIADSEEAPDLDDVFPVVEGTDLTDAEVFALARVGVKVDVQRISRLENRNPKLPNVPAILKGQGRHRGKPSSTGVSRRALEKALEEKQTLIVEKKRKRDAGKQLDRELNAVPKMRNGRVVYGVRTVTDKLEDILVRSNSLRMKVKRDESVGEFERKVEVEVRTGVHNLILGQEPTCDCTTFRKMANEREKWKHCEHLYALMYRGLQMKQKFDNTPVLLVHQPTFSKKEARKMCSQALDLVALS